MKVVYWCKTCSPEIEKYDVCVLCARRAHLGHSLIPSERQSFCSSTILYLSPSLCPSSPSPLPLIFIIIINQYCFVLLANEEKRNAMQTESPSLLETSFPPGVSWSSGAVTVPSGVRYCPFSPLSSLLSFLCSLWSLFSSLFSISSLFYLSTLSLIIWLFRIRDKHRDIQITVGVITSNLRVVATKVFFHLFHSLLIIHISIIITRV